MSQKSKVYFTKVVSPEKLIELYNKLDIKLKGNIAVKVHSGEKGNQNFVFHKKSKSINNKLSLKDFDCDNNLISVQVNTNNFIFNNDLKNRTNVITEDKNEDKEDIINNNINNTNIKINTDKIDEMNFIKTIDDMKQNVLDYYYDKNSAFKQKIDNLNLKFYLETEKYLNNSKKNDSNRNQKLQANLFIILFQQINVFIEEIERLNKIILDNKFKKEQILLRTNELNEKKNDILLKDNLIQSLKQSNTNTEKKLLETLLHEDKLMKDNQRLRKENETYKTLTIVFEKELKNTMKKSGLTPQKNKVTRHVKTYSDYGVPTNSIINELSGYNNAFSMEEKYDTINNDVKYTTARNKENNSVNSNKDNYMTNKNNYSLNSLLVDKKLKSSESNKYGKFNKIGKNSNLTENNSIRDKKINNKNIINTNRIKLKQSQDNKTKLKKDIYNFSKIENKNILNKQNNNSNISSNFAYNKKDSIKRKKLNVIIKKKNNAMNIDSTLNNINSLINSNNTNIMTEVNNNTSYEKIKETNNNLKKTEDKKAYYHKKQKTMSEISFNEIVRVNILNDDLNNTVNKGKTNKIKIKRIEERNNNTANKKSPLNKGNAKYIIKKHI